MSGLGGHSAASPRGGPSPRGGSAPASSSNPSLGSSTSSNYSSPAGECGRGRGASRRVWGVSGTFGGRGRGGLTAAIIPATPQASSPFAGFGVSISTPTPTLPAAQAQTASPAQAGSQTQAVNVTPRSAMAEEPRTYATQPESDEKASEAMQRSTATAATAASFRIAAQR